MKALVLGGCGFIGSHVVDALLEAGHVVSIMDRSPLRNDCGWAGVEHFLGDLDQVDVLARALAGVDVVYHLVSTTFPSTSNLDPIADVEGNLVATIRLLDLMRDAGCRRIVYFSSGGTVYGEPVSVPVDELHPLKPICSYGIVKLAIENYLFMYHRMYGLESVILRVSNPYGPRQGKTGLQGLIGTVLNRLRLGEPMVVWGNGETIRDYIYVKDLARLALIVGDTNASTGVFNAGSGQGHSVNELLSLASKVTGIELFVDYQPARTFDVHRIVLSIEASKSTFRWQPATSIEDGLRTTWEYIVALPHSPR